MTVQFKLKRAGYCEAKSHHAVRSSKKETIRFYGSFALIIHPTHGYILFDTGYTRRFYSGTEKWPFNIYAQVTKVFIEESDEACVQLKREGIQTEDIKYIIVSHFHADHIGGLKDFPNARFICSIAAFENIKYSQGIAALKKGFIPSLMPEDFLSRVNFINFSDAAINDRILGRMFDLFADGSILLCELDGHAKGQIGALLKTEKGKSFLISDAAWLKRNYTDLDLPSPIVKLFFDSWKDYKFNLEKIHRFYIANPDIPIIPCHCDETYNIINANPT